MFKKKKKVPVTPPAVFQAQEINAIYDEVKQVLGLSGYATITAAGEIHYEKFPVDVQRNMPLYGVLKQRVLDTERKYKQAQSDTFDNFETSKDLTKNDLWNSWLKHDHQGMIRFNMNQEEYGLMEEQFFNYAYLPGTENDDKVQKTLKTMKHIFSLAELIEKFELALINALYSGQSKVLNHNDQP